MTDDGPRGLDCSEAFVEYLERFRERHPVDPELAVKHGAPAGNGYPTSEHMSQANTDEAAQLETNLTRRRFMAASAATAAAVVAGTGPAAADHSSLNYESGLVPDPWLEGTVAIADHDRTEFDSVTEYYDDESEPADLADHGAIVAPGPDEDTPHNPITLRADRIDAEEYHKFPRGETYDEDGDGEDDADLDAIDAEHWTVDESGSGGSLTVEDVDAPSEGPGLRMSASGQTSGDTAVGTFDDFTIESGELKKYLQLGVTVDALPSGAVVTVRLEDSTGATVDAQIDPSADASQDGVIAASTVTGHVYQVQLGTLADSLDTIESLEVRVEGGDPDVTFFAINVEKSSRWAFGSEEYTNADDELDTRTVHEPSGEYSITGIDTLGDDFESAALRPVKADLRFETSGATEATVHYEFNDLDHPSYEREFRMAVNRELPTGYDLEYLELSFRDKAAVWPEQYGTLSVATNLDETQELGDVEDLDTVDRSSAMEDKGDEIDLSSSVAEGKVQLANYQLRIDPSDEEQMVASGPGGPAASGGGGFFSSARGMLVGVLGGVGTFWVVFRSRLMGE